MNKNNNSESPLFLCNDTDNKCKKLIEMANIIVLNKLLKDQSYINKNNDIAYTILNYNINKSTNKLNLPEMTKEEREKYENENLTKLIN